MPQDFHGASLAEVEDEVRVRVARAGYHLCTPLQQTNCQAQNLLGKNLSTGEAREEAFEAIVILATLDAFWSHTSKTVSGYVTDVNFMTQYAILLGFDPFPRLGPSPMGTHLGMKEAMMVVMRPM